MFKQNFDVPDSQVLQSQKLGNPCFSSSMQALSVQFSRQSLNGNYEKIVYISPTCQQPKFANLVKEGSVLYVQCANQI